MFWPTTEVRGYTQYCDNEGVVKSIQSALKYDNYYPNTTMAADWDVIHEIVVSIKDLPTPLTVLHIKGHQDDQIPYDDLSLPAQLNVDADSEAELYQAHDHTGHCTTVIRFPHAYALLNVQSGTMTNKYKREIINLRTAPALKAKIIKDNRWTEDTFNSVEWYAHGQVFRKN